MTVEKFKTKTFMFSPIYVFPVLFLPYALGRADWTHAVPFFCSVILLLGYAVRSTKKILKQRVLLLCMVLLLPSFFRLAVVPLKDILIHHQDASTELQSQLANCNLLTKNLPAQTIFVGRESYNRFIYSAAALYFLRPKLLPATRYISDEPGIQNSCEYGQLIYRDLFDAKKPMIALLEQGEQLAEQNRTATMQNCGKLEKFLQEQPHEKIGECTAYTRLFSIEVYK